MIGKIKKLDFKILVFFITITIFVGSIYVNNYTLLLIFLLSFFTAIVSTKQGISLIQKLNFFQNIQKEVLSKHKEKKFTPTMGGLFIIPLFLLLILLIDFPSFSEKIILFFCVLGYFLIGFIDDLISNRNKTNLGLNTKDKFTLQSLVAILFIFIAKESGILNFDIGILNNTLLFQSLIFALIFLIIVGLSNAVNLTDGLDGLAVGCSAITFCGLGTEILLRNDQSLIIYSFLCFTLSGLCLGFLKYNKFPAQIFLGDTGSLCLGAILGFICVLSNSFYTTITLSGIFIVETFSVIIQVSYFKLTKRFFLEGKRIFLMSPIHHHFELKGIQEEKIVDTFWKINIMFMFLVIVLEISF